jgi:stage II sporulation protein E
MVRTLKQKVLAGAGDGQAQSKEVIAQKQQENSISKQLALLLIFAISGLFMPRAAVYGGMTPFGVSFAAAVPGAGAALVYIASLVGYLLPGGAAVPLRYIAALAAVAGIKWSLSGIKSAAKHPVFAPVITFLSIVSTGLALSSVNGLDAFSIFMVTAEGLLAGGAAFFFCTSVNLISNDEIHNILTAQEQASIVMTGSIILMAVTAYSFSGIAPGRIIAAVLILLLARCGKEQGGSIAGIVLGIAMSMAGSEHLYLAAAFAFGGLVAGIFARFGRFASAGAFLAANLIVVVTTGKDTLIIVGIYEVISACLIFVAMPASVDRFINRFFLNAKELPAVEGLRRSVVMRLDYASKAMNEVAQAVDAVSQKLAGLSAPDLGSVYRSISDDICRVCGLRMQCWEKQFNDTMAALNELTPVLREKGYAEKSDIPPSLSRYCGRLDEVLRKINSGYLEHAVREGAWRRLGEIRSVVTDQFQGMSDMLDELAQDLSRTEQVDADAASRVTDVCEEYGMAVQDAVCLLGRGGRMTVEILASDTGVKLNKLKWQNAIQDACGKELDHPVVTRLGDSVKITMTEKPLLTVKSCSAQLQCAGQRLCGDAFEIFTDGTGKWYSVLSDGMGNGGRAAVDGAMASGLTARLIQAGFGPDSVMRMVNSALMVKSGDESLSTLDIMELDLFNGKVEFRKAGASPTLLCSMGRVSKIEKSSLPIGILREIRAERSEDTLVDGDIILMCSDGVYSAGTEWVEELLGNFDAKTGDLKKLAEDIASTARSKQKDHQDDITVIAIQVNKKQ